MQRTLFEMRFIGANSGRFIAPRSATRASPFQQVILAIVFEPVLRSVRLGLFVIKEIAKAHSSELTASPGTTQGMTFAVRFPANPQR